VHGVIWVETVDKYEFHKGPNTELNVVGTGEMLRKK
jgi:hypothetical protein